MSTIFYQKYRKQWHKMIKKTLEALKVEANTPGSQIPFSFHGSDAPLNNYRSMSRSTTSSSEHEFGGSNTSDSTSANGVIDIRTKQINKIKEQVIKYAVMAWHDKFQRIYPINGCESYSVRGTLMQRWQGSGRIYLSHKQITVIADSGNSSGSGSGSEHGSGLAGGNQKHTLIDVPVTDLVGIYDIPDERMRAGEKWKKQEKDKERTEEEIEETKQLQANLYKKLTLNLKNENIVRFQFLP